MGQCVVIYYQDINKAKPKLLRKDAAMNFENELQAIINRYSQENASNTPDFILAQYLVGCLAAWNTAVQQRETWYGRNAQPAVVCSEPLTGT